MRARRQGETRLAGIFNVKCQFWLISHMNFFLCKSGFYCSGMCAISTCELRGRGATTNMFMHRFFLFIEAPFCLSFSRLWFDLIHFYCIKSTSLSIRFMEHTAYPTHEHPLHQIQLDKIPHTHHSAANHDNTPQASPHQCNTSSMANVTDNRPINQSVSQSIIHRHIHHDTPVHTQTMTVHE